MHERIIEHERDIRLSRTQTSAVSENTPIRSGIIRSGTKLRLLTETLTGTLIELRRLST